MNHTGEDSPVFRTRAQLKRHQARIHNAQYQDRKDHPEMYQRDVLREAIVDTVKGFQKGLGL